MKTQQILTLTLSVLAICLLTSCGTSKSTTTAEGASKIDISSELAMATCNRSISANLSFNLASISESTTGQINPDWIKIKFDFLSVDVTKSGYHLKFYKWRVIGGSAQLDPEPLTFSTYQLSTNGLSNEMLTGIYTAQINKQSGYYIRLNDDANYPYQVLKVVAYKTDGTVAAQSDVLIPQFSASPTAYKINSDLSARAQNLQKMHPLYATDTTGWTQTQFKQNFDKYCF